MYIQYPSTGYLIINKCFSDIESCFHYKLNNIYSNLLADGLQHQHFNYVHVCLFYLIRR